MALFYPEAAAIPVELRTAEYCLRPLRVTDVELDYDAVMATGELLRAASGGRWPRPDFTIEENRADLEEHEAEFASRRGFTYTVVNLSGTQCLGAVYLYPPSHVLAGRIGEQDGDVVSRFWLRPEALALE